VHICLLLVLSVWCHTAAQQGVNSCWHILRCTHVMTSFTRDGSATASLRSSMRTATSLLQYSHNTADIEYVLLRQSDRTSLYAQTNKHTSHYVRIVAAAQFACGKVLSSSKPLALVSTVLSPNSLTSNRSQKLA
jgi:hypothetical protein